MIQMDKRNNEVVPVDYMGSKVRRLKIDGEPWFVGADVCRMLALKANPTNGAFTIHFKKLDADQKRVMRIPDSPAYKTTLASEATSPAYQIHGRTIPATFVSESGLYTLLIMRSDKPEAKKFQDWVCGTVLPAIRKDGMYVMGEEKVITGEMSEDELILKAGAMATTKLERLSRERSALEENSKAPLPSRDQD